MNQRRIWNLWKAAPNGHSTAEIARRMTLPEHQVYKVVNDCLDAVYCNLPMPWNRSAA